MTDVKTRPLIFYKTSIIYTNRLYIFWIIQMTLSIWKGLKGYMQDVQNAVCRYIKTF